MKRVEKISKLKIASQWEYMCKFALETLFFPFASTSFNWEQSDSASKVILLSHSSVYCWLCHAFVHLLACLWPIQWNCITSFALEMDKLSHSEHHHSFEPQSSSYSAMLLISCWNLFDSLLHSIESTLSWISHKILATNSTINIYHISFAGLSFFLLHCWRHFPLSW